MSYVSKISSIVVAFVLASLTTVVAQSYRPTFEVVSVKPNASGNGFVYLGSLLPGGRFTATGVTLRMMMGPAFHVWDFQVFGGPDWTASLRWDIEAKAPETNVAYPTISADPTKQDRTQLLLQSLLEDRFQLKWHRETRELPVYALDVSKGGTKLKKSDDQTPAKPLAPASLVRGAPLPRGMMRNARGYLEATGVPLSELVVTLGQQLQRPIVDKTGLTGLYDIKLQWTPDPVGGGGPSKAPEEEGARRTDQNGVSIFTAIEEQLGLRLESTKAPVEVLLIDSVQRPSEN